MVVTELSDTLIADGAKLVQRLDEAGVDVPVAFWMRPPEVERWRLALSMPAAAKESPQKAYRVVRKALKDIQKEVGQLALDNVTILRPREPLLGRIRAARRTGPGLFKIRRTGSAVHGELLPDTLLYRVT